MGWLPKKVSLCGKILFFMIMLAYSPAWGTDVINVVVSKAMDAPTVDGQLDDWSGEWISIPVRPAIKDDKKNFVGESQVEMQAVTQGGRIFVAARWADRNPDLNFKPWIWNGNRYRRGKQQDDMFALRFDMEGSYDDCMLSKKTYSVDVWLWSAARTNEQGYAEDMNQHISTTLLESAAEYEAEDGTIIYIRKRKDAGDPIYITNRIDKKNNQGASVASVLPTDNPSGSIADVRARGLWKDGYWHLEMSRQLDTGNSDDRELKTGTQVLGAVAVFNRAGSEHKSNSPTLIFDIK